MPLTPKRVFRQFRYAMYFNGVNNYVKVPYNPSLNITSEVTIEGFAVWLGGSRVIAADKYAHYRWIDVVSPAGNVRVETWDGVRGLGYVNTPWTLPLGSVFHFTKIESWTRGYASVILNAGEQKATYTFTPTTISGNANDFYIGVSGEIAYYWYGYIITVRLYSRALSDSEIQFNYQNPDKPIRNGLVLWLQADPNNVKDIDGDGILEWIDLSGYNNHGKIYNAQLVEVVKTPTRVLTPVRVLSPVR